MSLTLPMARSLVTPLPRSLIEGAGVAAGVVFDMDVENGRFWWKQSYPSEAALLAAMGASKSGEARTFTPYVFGDELMPDPGFGSGVDSWASAPSYTGGGTLSHATDKLRATQNNAAYRFRRPTTVGLRKAYAFGIDIVATGIVSTGMSISGANNTDGGGGEGVALVAPYTGRAVTYHASESTTSYFGVQANAPGSVGVVTDLDNQSVRECCPFEGLTPGVVAGRITATAPASFASAQVLAQWGANSERNRVRLASDTSGNLHFIVTTATTAVADLTLGALVAGEEFTVDFSAAELRYIAALDGAVAVGDITGNIAGLPRMWLGRSWTGETWGGSIRRVTLYDEERLPRKGIVAVGDSYVDRTFNVNLPATAVADGRGMMALGVGGSTLADQAAVVAANPGLMRDGVFVHWDGEANGFTDLATAMASYASLLAGLGHSRFLIVSPLRRANLSSQENADTLALQQALAAAYPANYIDAQAILAAHATSPGDDVTVAAGQIPASLLQGDGTHLTSAAMGYVWSEATVGIKAVLAAKGW